MASTAEHLERTRAAMAEAEIDLLVLGREANARYVSGARRLWLAGTRPFAPGCVLVRETGAVHLLSVTDDGVPATVPRERLYPLSWNPVNLAGAVADAAADVSVRRVGVDGMSPLFASLLSSVLPGATFVDGEALLRAVRRVKTADDVAAVGAATSVAGRCVDALVAAVTSGARGATLRGVFEERMAHLGVTTPAFEPVITVGDGDWSVRAGVIRDGWEGLVSRSGPQGARARGAVTAAVDACRPGTTVEAVEALGVRVDGVGLGHEDLRGDDVLAVDMVLFVEAVIDGAAHGETVWVAASGPEVVPAG